MEQNSVPSGSCCLRARTGGWWVFSSSGRSAGAPGCTDVVTWYRGDGVVSLAMMNRVRPAGRCCWCGTSLLSCGCGHKAGGGTPVHHDGERLCPASRSSGPCKAARRPTRSHQGSLRRGRGRHQHCSRAAPINRAAIPL